MRTKTEYVVEKDERGKSAPRKIGTAPVQKEGLEYEFDVSASIDLENTMHVEKSRCPAMQGAIIRKPGADVAKILRAWLSEGVAAPPPAAQADLVDYASSSEVADLLRSVFATARNPADLAEAVKQTRKAQSEQSISDATYKELVKLHKARKAELAATVASDSAPEAEGTAAAQ